MFSKIADIETNLKRDMERASCLDTLYCLGSLGAHLLATDIALVVIPLGTRKGLAAAAK